jgi:nicotinamide-nucleotide amidase
MELRQRQEQIAVAESLTGGQLSGYLASAPEASQWLRGGLVAYQAEVKQNLLGVKPGPVVTQETAEQMANGIAALLDANLTIAVTGVGGLTGLIMAVGWEWSGDFTKPTGGSRYHDETVTQLLHLQGDPETVCRQTCRHALGFAFQRLTGSV